MILNGALAGLVGAIMLVLTLPTPLMATIIVLLVVEL